MTVAAPADHHAPIAQVAIAPEAPVEIVQVEIAPEDHARAGPGGRRDDRRDDRRHDDRPPRGSAAPSRRRG